MNAFTRNTIDYAAYMAVRLLISVIQTLPEDKAIALARFGAWLFSGPIPIRRSILRENFAIAFPNASDGQRKQLTRAMWNHLFLMVCEIAWAPRRLHRCNWRRFVHCENPENFLKPLLSRRPTVFVTGHFGNFELGGYITGLMGISTCTIARRLDNPYLNKYVSEFRELKGQRILEKSGCAQEVDRHLATGGTLSLLADQHAGPKGCWVDFLGKPASCHKALALFSLGPEAPMAVAFTIRNQRPMQFVLGATGVADPREHGHESRGVRELTEWYNIRLGEAISKAPEQYWWVHRRWRERPERGSKREKAAA